MEKISSKRYVSRLRSEEVVAGFGIILFSVTILLQIPGSYGNVMLFPTIVGSVSLLSGVSLVLTGFLKPPVESVVGFNQEWIAIAISTFIFAAVFFCGKVGFYFSLFIICLAVNYLIALFCGEKGAGKALASLVLAALMTGIIYLVFDIFLGIVTPVGVLV